MIESDLLFTTFFNNSSLLVQFIQWMTSILKVVGSSPNVRFFFHFYNFNSFSCIFTFGEPSLQISKEYYFVS